MMVWMIKYELKCPVTRSELSSLRCIVEERQNCTVHFGWTSHEHAKALLQSSVPGRHEWMARRDVCMLQQAVCMGPRWLCSAKVINRVRDGRRKSNR